MDHNNLREFIRILDKVDAGLETPRHPGAVGRFLRQYGSARRTIGRFIEANSLGERQDGAISGRSLGPIRIHALGPLEPSVLQFPLGEVADGLGISEELGTLARLVLWLRGPRANRVFNRFRTGTMSVELVGDYRWTPLTKLTPGEASVDDSPESLTWQSARCLKAVADDVRRPPHALEYMIDYRMGPPGIKCFRSICARLARGRCLVLPALDSPLELSIQGSRFPHDDTLAQLLIYREPWSGSTWRVVDIVECDHKAVVEHSIAWLDFRLELGQRDLDGQLMDAVTIALDGAGIDIREIGLPNLRRHVLPAVYGLIREIRGLR